MTANFLQFQENGLEISITIPPRVEDGGESSEAKLVPLNQLHSAASGLKHHTGECLASSKYPFVWKIHEMLEDAESSKQESIVSWVRNGHAFKVHHLHKFVEEIIPKYWKLSKYKSFQRQLYIYGFTRIHYGPDEGAYHHPNFIRGMKTLCLSMAPKNNSSRRQSRTSASSSSASSSSLGQCAKKAATAVDVKPPPFCSDRDGGEQLLLAMKHGASCAAAKPFTS